MFSIQNLCFPNENLCFQSKTFVFLREINVFSPKPSRSVQKVENNSTQLFGLEILQNSQYGNESSTKLRFSARFVGGKFVFSVQNLRFPKENWSFQPQKCVFLMKKLFSFKNLRFPNEDWCFQSKTFAFLRKIDVSSQKPSFI